MLEKVNEIPPLSEEELKLDRQINSFMEDIASRFINTEGIQQPSPDERVEINIHRVKAQGDHGIIMENLHISQTGSLRRETPSLRINFRVPNIGSFSMDNAFPYHVRPKLTFFDEKSQKRLEGRNALDSATKVLGSFRSLPGK
jgi:hypothetical protein